MNLIIVDSAPLILLAKLSLLDRVGHRFHLIVPSEVALETTCRQDLPDARYIQELIKEGYLNVEKPRHQQTVKFQNEWNVGGGEAAALVLAIEKKGVVMTDDYAAMRVAKVLRIPFVTTIDILLELHRHKLMSRNLTLAKLLELKKHAWISPFYISMAIKKIEEGG
jgi:predicted nucleic acid-binding protein